MRLLALGLLLAGCVPYTVGPDHVLHPRRDRERALALDPDAVAAAVPGATVQPWALARPDGAVLRGAWVRHPAADRPTVLYFGGNGFRVSTLGMKKLVPLLRLGVDVVMLDHRGYGQSDGTASVDSLKADALAVFDAVAAEAGGTRVVVHGHSLGSFLASWVGAEREAGGVVLENSATTTRDYVRSRSDLYPILHLVRFRIDPALAGEGSLGPVRRITEPLLIVAGAGDARIPSWMSQALYEASPLPPGRKRLRVFARPGHDRVPLDPDFPGVYRAFLRDAGL